MSRPTAEALVGAECITGSRRECKLLTEEIATDDRFRGSIPYSDRAAGDAKCNQARGRTEKRKSSLLPRRRKRDWWELLVGVDDKRGINACKLTGVRFTTAIAIPLRSRHKGLINRNDARARLSSLARHGRYQSSILEDAKPRLEEQL